MSESNRFHQRIKKISRFITSKVREKRQNSIVDPVFQKRDIVRRHSSYIQQAKSVERDSVISLYPSQKKEEIHHTISYSQIPICSALSPPPRHFRDAKQKSLSSIEYRSSISVKPCLDRSNTLGHHSTSTLSCIIVQNTTTPDRTTPIIVNPSSSSSSLHHCHSNNQNKEKIPCSM